MPLSKTRTSDDPKPKAKSKPKPQGELTLRSPHRSRERILAFGIQGAGKSHQGLMIARYSPGSTIYIIDNDNAYERLLETDFTDLRVKKQFKGWEPERGKIPGKMKDDDEYSEAGGNIVLFRISKQDTWEQTRWAIEYVMRECESHDWLLIDSLSSPWEEVQEWFVRQIFGSTINEYFMQVRAEKKEADDKATAKKDKESKALGALEGWKDWPAINSEYKDGIRIHLKEPNCHLYVTCELDALSSDEKDKAVKKLYGAHGVKPKGQKRSGHDVQTVFIFEQVSKDRWTATTVKDRGRERWVSHTIDEFPQDYLVESAGFVKKEVTA